MVPIVRNKEGVVPNTKIEWWEIALMFFLLSISGNPYVQGENYDVFIIASFAIPAIHVLRNYKKSVSYRTITILVFLLGYEILHAFMFKLDYTLTFFKISLALLLAVATADILKDRIIPVLTKTMIYISLVSFVFVFLCYIPGINRFLFNLAANLFPIEPDWKGHFAPTLLIFTFHPEFFRGEFNYVRNAGIFWESGAFAVFLIVTLFLHYSTRPLKTFKDLFDKKALILIVAVISTASTMALIALLTLLSLFSSQMKTVLKYVLIVFIVIACYLTFSTVEFMGDKVRKQLSESGTTNNRFGSALKDLDDFSKRPIFGWSRRNEVLFGTTLSTALTHRPNGLTNLLRSYGLLYFTIYFILVFQTYKVIRQYYLHRTSYIIPAFGILLLFIVSFSEQIFDLIFFKFLIFVYAAYPISSLRAEQIIKKPVYFISQSVSAVRKRFTY